MDEVEVVRARFADGEATGIDVGILLKEIDRMQAEHWEKCVRYEAARMTTNEYLQLLQKEAAERDETHQAFLKVIESLRSRLGPDR